ncbi:MAG: hypothetical protein ACRC0L_06150, partial [Angustibacter sp.]
MNLSPISVKWIRGLSFFLSALLIFFGVLSVLGSLARKSATEERRLTTGNRLEIDSEYGEVELRPSSTGLVLARSYSWSWGRPRLEVTRFGGTLRVRDTCPMMLGRGCAGKITLGIPPGLTVKAHSSAGDVLVAGMSGDLELSSSAGSVRAIDLESESVKIDSSAGQVDLAF